MDYTSVTHTTTDRRLGRLPSGRDVSVTVHRYVGGPGPTVYIQAAQHGIELNGPAALRRLHDHLTDAAVAGTVIVVPVVNQLAFDHRSYMTPGEYDVMNPNLNRVWPGDASGSLQEQFAARLWELVTDADAAVDLHTGTADMLEHVRCRAGDPAAKRLAQAFGTSYRLTDGHGDGDDGSGGTFRAAAAGAGIPVITAELSNSRRIAQSAVAAGVDGIRNLLRDQAVLPADPEPRAEQTVLRNDAEAVTASESGLFECRSDIAVGDTVDAGERLGTVYEPSSFEQQQVVSATERGVIFSLARESVVVKGERLAGIATPE
ncbi:succinylglutamate desuccinylase/aspartoacylase family protein [Haloarcula sp. 1CSR25-25]|uniref:succinylglutamate desuccinylase/aspartoacylase family protein n=1 Tax=Haloarcula sp. 1CSR25-25 TaxID=2862545 RepID=UPI0028944176|nr:succinylglutamate desuccinylase/aspartoacylase family protein [Haloarcula sp. 1CSR25-25]MDT3435885.1 succinylglutamate desuccinylase/aspartoacylase family protein [Haloarcula sp. 1CSR25-25]